jgi:hypothetical protein
MSTTPANPSVGPAGELFLVGLYPGCPPHLSARSAAIDRRLCRHLDCPACGHSGLSYRPFTDGRRYVVLASCPDCGCGTEV